MPRFAAHSGWLRTFISIRINVAPGTSAEEFLTDFTPGCEMVLESCRFVASGDGAGAGATRTLRVIKGTATVAATGTVALASTTTKGAITALTPASDLIDRTFRDGDLITVDLASGGTQFTTLTGNVILRFRQRLQADA